MSSYLVERYSFQLRTTALIGLDTRSHNTLSELFLLD